MSIWSILGAVLPWTSLAMLAMVVYQTKKNGRLKQRLELRESQLRLLSEELSRTKAECVKLHTVILETRLQCDSLNKQLQQARAKAESDLATATKLAIDIAEGRVNGDDAAAKIKEMWNV